MTIQSITNMELSNTYIISSGELFSATGFRNDGLQARGHLITSIGCLQENSPVYTKDKPWRNVFFFVNFSTILEVDLDKNINE